MNDVIRSAWLSSFCRECQVVLGACFGKPEAAEGFISEFLARVPTPQSLESLVARSLVSDLGARLFKECTSATAGVDVRSARLVLRTFLTIQRPTLASCSDEQRARHWIDEHWRDVSRTSQVSRACGVPVTRLARSFRIRYGISI